MRALSFDLPPGAARPTVKLIELEKPRPKGDDILVRVTHAGLSHGDFEIITGQRNKSLIKLLKTQPVVSGIEMAGIAETGGKLIAKGDRVFGYANIFKGPRFHGDYVALSEEKLFSVPQGWTTEEAAAIVGGGVTAIAALERIAKLKAQDKVLITGASGAVGILAVQLANHIGAEITGICNSAQTDQVRAAGAATILAYDKNEAPKGHSQFDCVFDTAPSLSFQKARPMLKPQGIYITTMPHRDIGGFLRSLFSRRRWGFLLESDTDQKRLGRLAALMAEGAFQPSIDSSYSLTNASAAFSRLEQRGKCGKVLLEFLP